jgi:hypothetical protein
MPAETVATASDEIGPKLPHSHCMPEMELATVELDRGSLRERCRRSPKAAPDSGKEHMLRWDGVSGEQALPGVLRTPQKRLIVLPIAVTYDNHDVVDVELGASPCRDGSVTVDHGQIKVCRAARFQIIPRAKAMLQNAGQGNRARKVCHRREGVRFRLAENKCTG